MKDKIEKLEIPEKIIAEGMNGIKIVLNDESTLIAQKINEIIEVINQLTEDNDEARRFQENT
jgi:hypothetical protein